ncbi:hypothetical protein [Rhodohalobacter halophilus]|uniref:hypothetical protein n=1 Tax=Rhodohalobacter halophilus TaxID=1812810 RepID=UPI00083F658A|nr:hypothetical protein [Rhodohalobacter halophilus]
MGRAMLIICAGVLMSIGIISMGTNSTARMITQQNVDYAEYTMAKNAAHTAVQMAMQEINKDDDWPNSYSETSPWVTEVQGLEVRLHTVYEQNDYWTSGDHDNIWFYSKAQLGKEFGNRFVEVRSRYEKRPFFELVPDFTGALQLPTDVGNFNVDGAAHEINGVNSSCPENKPPITTQSQTTKDKLLLEPLKKDGGDLLDGDIVVDSELNYEPTDELIERLLNSGYAETIYGDKSQYGTATTPGVFLVEDQVKLKGNTEGYGILIIRDNGNMEMESDPELSVAGNFTFNGLVIFENAKLFDGKGTPTINGSVLIGNTGDNLLDPIDIDLGGNIEINYDCKGENYAKMAAANAVEQNKYTILVATENIRRN